MSGPTMSSMAQAAGLTQTVATPKTTSKVTRESEQARMPFGGDEEDHKEGAQAGKPGGQAGQAGKAGQSQQSQQKGPVRRKRVKLKDIKGKQTEQQSGTKGTEKYSELSRQKEARPKGEATNARELGYKRAASLLSQNSKITESSVRYEQARKLFEADPSNALSPKAQQKWMLNNLIRMISLCVHQHTGGRAGEAYESRRDCRNIWNALRGLFDSGRKTEGGITTRRPLTKHEYNVLKKKIMYLFENAIEPRERPEDMPEYEDVA